MVQPALEPQRRLIGFFRLAPLLAALLLTHGAVAQQAYPGANWQLVPPAKSGWSDEGLAEARKRSEQLHATGIIIVHHGALVAEWGDTEKRAEHPPVRTSQRSALIGIAVAEHKI